MFVPDLIRNHQQAIECRQGLQEGQLAQQLLVSLHLPLPGPLTRRELSHPGDGREHHILQTHPLLHHRG